MRDKCYGGCHGHGLDTLEVSRTIYGQRTLSVGLGRDIRPLSSLVDSAGWPNVFTAISAGAP